MPRAERVVRFFGWVSLLCLLASCILPNLAAIKNIAAGLGVLVLVAARISKCFAGIPTWYLRVCLLAYVGSVLVSAVVPNLVFLPDTTNLSISLHAAVNTLKAVVAAGLVMLLLRSEDDLRLFCVTWMIMIMAVVMGELIQPYLADMPSGRLSGTKGDPNRYSLMLFFSLVPMAVIGLKRKIRCEQYPEWLGHLGFLVAILTPIIMNRKRLAGFYQVCDKWGTLLTICVLVGLMTCWWFVFARAWRARPWLLAGAFCLLMVNVGLAATRSIMVALCVWLLIIGVLGIRRTYLVAAIVVICVGASWLLYVRYSTYGTPLGQDFAVRSFIARGGVRIFKKYPVLGAGYGILAFRREWPFRRPYPEPIGEQVNWPPFHAHNLTLQIMATQGLLGLVAFEALWLAGVVFLYRRLRQVFAGLSLNRVLPELFAGNGQGRIIVIIALGTLMVLQVIGLLTVPLIKGNEILLWVVVGMGFAGCCEGCEEKGREEEPWDEP